MVCAKVPEHVLNIPLWLRELSVFQVLERVAENSTLLDRGQLTVVSNEDHVDATPWPWCSVGVVCIRTSLACFAEVALEDAKQPQ